MTYDQLPQNPAPGVVLQCFCGEFSACRGDYFMAAPGKKVCPCHECGIVPMLVQKRVRYVRVSPAKAEARP